LLHLGFAFTGVGTVLLGSILPQLSRAWHLRDSDAGLLLLVQFAASATGALAVRRNLFRSLRLGYALFALGGLGIFVLRQPTLRALVPLIAVFGVGLGLAMTSTNLLVGQEPTDHRGSALALLNFAWSAGAVGCPVLAVQVLQHASGGAAFGLLGLVVLPFALLPLLAGSWAMTLPATQAATLPSGWQETATLAYFAALAFLYVGVEATLSNWMSSYAMRTGHWPLGRLGGGSLAVSVFWAAFLAGRATTPAMLARMRERMLYCVATLAALGSIALLLSAHSAQGILAGSAIAGFSLGPLFPLTLSLFLAAIGGSRNRGWVFAIAGLGGAVLSWLTGALSSHTGSLRIGLLVPMAAMMLMLAMTTKLKVPDSAAAMGAGPLA
jgi:fucose permease